MGNLVAILIIGLTIYTLIKKGIKEALAMFFFGCVLVSAVITKTNLSTVGNVFWKLLKEVLGGVTLG